LRRANVLLWVVVILVLISTLLAVVMKVAFIQVKHTSDSYMVQRAELFMQSVIENSILAIEGYDRKSKGNCLESINFEDDRGLFDANVSVLRYYCYEKSDDCPCANAKRIKTDISHGYVLLKVLVSSKDKKVKLEKVVLQRP
jgi:hypothetical protein